MAKYKVHPLDVWGNASDGYEVNDIYPSLGTVEIPENATDREIIAALKRGGFVECDIQESSVDVEDTDDEWIFVEYEGLPVYQLRLVSN